MDEWIEGECQQMELLVFSASVMTPTRTMKLQGRINWKLVILLINSGANHNFVSTNLVKKLGLRAEKNASFYATGRWAQEGNEGVLSKFGSDDWQLCAEGYILLVRIGGVGSDLGDALVGHFRRGKS